MKKIMFLELQKNLIFKSISLILIILSLITAFLIFNESKNSDNLCFIGDNCFKIWKSDYGYFLNIEWAKWGIFYSFFLLLLLIYDIIFSKDFKFLIFFYFLGALISFYLIIVQFFALKYLCFYCLIYDLLIIILFFLNLFKKRIIYFFSKIIKVSK